MVSTRRDLAVDLHRASFFIWLVALYASEVFALPIVPFMVIARDAWIVNKASVTSKWMSVRDD